MKISEFSKLLGKKPVNFRECEINEFVIDSRIMQKGDFFVAIKTDKNDGHNYLEHAKEKGACGYLASAHKRSLDFENFSNIFVVGDTVAALQNAASKHIELKAEKKIAITGSAGKTTTKELIAHIFKLHYKTASTIGNFNNTLGLPLSILNNVKSRVDYFVAELGMSYRGEISRLIKILKPQIRIWLNVYSAHLGNFESIEELRDAKGEILNNADPYTVTLYNYDDILIKTRVENTVGIKYSFGKKSGADLKIENCKTYLDKTYLTLVFEGEKIQLESMLVGEHNCYNIAASVLVAILEGIPEEKIKQGVKTFIPVENRGRFVLKKGIYLFNDCYNSNPEALKKVINHFSLSEFKGRKVAVIGDMLELGRFSEDKHGEIGELLNRSDIDVVITWGKDMKFCYNLLNKKERYHFDTSEDVAKQIGNIVKEGDLVFVKASRGMKGEVIVNTLIEIWGGK